MYFDCPTKEDKTCALRESKLAQSNKSSRIVEFYSGRDVLLTGVTGFVGKFVLEKLIRSCPTIGQVYVLIRPKSSKPTWARLEKLLDEPIFDSIKQQDKSLLKKVVALSGDISLPQLGLNEQDLAKVVGQVSVVIHSAAFVGFHQLQRLLTSNIIGTNNVIEICKQMPKLVALVYVSTAYSNSIRTVIDEHVYPVEFEPKKVISLVDLLGKDKELLETIGGNLIGKYLTAYTFTKAQAEWLCRESIDKIPIVVCRPSVVVSSLREPTCGYLNNTNAINGIYTGLMCGLLHTTQGLNSVVLDQVPADMVSNCIIASGWFCHEFRTTRPKPTLGNSKPSDPIEGRLVKFKETVCKRLQINCLDEELAILPVFNIATAVANPISLGQFSAKILKWALVYPSEKLTFSPSFVYTENKYLNKFYLFMRHTLPANLMEFFSCSPEVVRAIRNYVKLSKACVPFLMKTWEFRTDNLVELNESFMNDEDRKLFDCNPKVIEWDEFCHNYAIGIRRFILNESLDNLEKGRARLAQLNLRNKTARFVLLAISSYLIARMWLI